ncbi:protection of telomeres protein 1b-like [Selaginella moellendorffii]|uniref:Protection of telomeres protein 1 n=1 Tax=Selaginella moellendorffii TaxID=88036 RepID=B7T1J9_SELML|nr:protection of telomeres protein 1b-like [Selaginella moellendorffii]ACJ49163.1 protection of telomeres 1 protein [Selaginella moellendorffii]|eukprot:XP_024520571.1 protection of telomeres protein 1b-like [Selaginella moellendorffii]
MEGEGKYEYMKLKDACIAVEQQVNFYGVVIDYSLPKPTKGKDMICTMTVADMSSPGLRVLVFGSKDHVPYVRALHDIIRFHRVRIDIHKGSPQAVASLGKASAFAVFDGGSGGSNEPYQISSNAFTFEEHDRRILDLMRAWRSTHLSKPLSTEYLVRIRDIKEPHSYFDLCCKVLHVSRLSDDCPTFVYVWDGTDSPATTSLPFVESPSLPLVTLRQFPSKGTVLQVVVDFASDEHGDWIPRVGSWVKFRNITSRNCGGKLEGVFTRDSKISILASDYPNVEEAERWYEHRLASAEAGLPENCPKPLLSLTVTDYDHVPYSSLREVLAWPQVTYKFRCLVRVRSANPPRAVDFCRCVNGQYVYQLQLTLEDPTAQIHAYLFAEDGERFFNGYPAARREAEDACLGALERSFSRLLCASDGLDTTPPYVSCCIKSYYVDKEQPWTSRRFRIFGTRFPG